MRGYIKFDEFLKTEMTSHYKQIGNYCEESDMNNDRLYEIPADLNDPVHLESLKRLQVRQFHKIRNLYLGGID